VLVKKYKKIYYLCHLGIFVKTGLKTKKYPRSSELEIKETTQKMETRLEVRTY